MLELLPIIRLDDAGSCSLLSGPALICSSVGASLLPTHCPLAFDKSFEMETKDGGVYN